MRAGRPSSSGSLAPRRRGRRVRRARGTFQQTRSPSTPPPRPRSRQPGWGRKQRLARAERGYLGRRAERRTSAGEPVAASSLLLCFILRFWPDENVAEHGVQVIDVQLAWLCRKPKIRTRVLEGFQIGTRAIRRSRLRRSAEIAGPLPIGSSLSKNSRALRAGCVAVPQR
jgi:hypothetical protein